MESIDLNGTDNPIKPMDELKAVYVACKFGRFHIRLLMITFIGSVASMLVTNTTAFLLPSAECDLEMDLIQKGLLNAMPYVGMQVSSLVAGFLTDTFGRKSFLQFGFGGIFLFTLLAGSSQTYNLLIAAKFFEGVLFATSISAVVTLTPEFCHDGIRERVVLCQASFSAIAQIIIPAMAWGILTQDWSFEFFNGYFVLNTWNIYLYAMSLWSLVACIMYSTLPESPKYLVAQKKYDESKNILINIYEENTKKPRDTFPFMDLWMNEPMEKKDRKTLKQQIVIGLRNVKLIFRMPLLLYVGMLSFMNFLIVGKYNVIRLWFPQLSTIVEHYEMDGSHDLCVLLDDYTSNLRKNSFNTTDIVDICIPKKSGSETYINSIIVGFVCLFPYFVLGVLVNKMGKKYLLIAAGLICIGATMGLRWADSKAIMVSLFSLDIAIALSMKSLTQAYAVEFFPTKIRTLATSFIMMCARIATLLGHVTFPILLDMGCAVPLFAMSGMMACVTFVSVFFPNRRNRTT